VALMTGQVYFDGYVMNEHRFELVAGARCLDFVNTVGDRTGQWRYVRNYLQRYEDLVSWGLQASVLSSDEATALRDLALRRPDDAAAALTRAVNLRETLHAVFSPVAAGHAIDNYALAAFNIALRPTLSMSRLVSDDRARVCQWEFDAQPQGDADAAALDRVIWAVARSAADLLTSPDLARIRQCALETCGWLFLDLSKNKTRRWCAMMMCGNRSKARRHRAARKRSHRAAR